METKSVSELLKNNTYPGRGIILGRSRDNTCAVMAYFIMGRSVNSRNRVFTQTSDGIRTEAYDSSKMTDPSLIIYHPVRRLETEDGTVNIVTNGDHTDTIYEYVASGKDVYTALHSRCFEPDGPHYTPRISGVLYSGGDYVMSILKTMNGNPDCCVRNFFSYDQPRAGTGHFIHTYREDGNPLPSFEGEPVQISIEGNIDAFSELLWASLNADNKVSLYVRYVNLQNGTAEERIINANK